MKHVKTFSGGRRRRREGKCGYVKENGGDKRDGGEELRGKNPPGKNFRLSSSPKRACMTNSNFPQPQFFAQNKPAIVKVLPFNNTAMPHQVQWIVYKGLSVSSLIIILGASPQKLFYLVNIPRVPFFTFLNSQFNCINSDSSFLNS